MLRLPIIGAALVAATLLVPNAIDASASVSFTRADFDSTSIGNIETDVFEMALDAASCAVRTGAVSAPETLTVIDYSKPSSERRLWVFDLKAKELVYEELVAHGQGSDSQATPSWSRSPPGQ